jgi:uncharacterized protein
MNRLLVILILLLLNLSPVYADDSVSHSESIAWQDWSDAAFQRAKKENKPVILDLEANWCHVMDNQTYSNPAVAKLISQHFIPLRVDQDSRPDLSNRYQDYGWPATIIFSPSGVEVAKRSGYIPTKEMVGLLTNVIKHPNTPEEPVSKSTVSSASATSLSDTTRSSLQKQCFAGYDPANGGWGTDQKFLDWDILEFCLACAKDKDVPAKGETSCAQMAKDTLKGELHLIDPIWGGAYQYSTDGDWVHPHFERIMQMQGEVMRTFASAYQFLDDLAYLKAAKDIERFMQRFLLSPEGAYYTSMNADLISGKHSAEYFELDNAERLKKGVPHVDTHIYSRENGWAINGLAALYQATLDKTYLDAAIKAANWIVANRPLPDGGFRHDAVDKAGPYFDDTLHMGRALLSLYESTADRKWLAQAEQAASFISQHFEIPVKDGAGYAIIDVSKLGALAPQALADQNVMVARWANLLFHYTGNTKYKQIAEHAMRYLARPEVEKKCGWYVAGILLADRELASAPLHITVVGSKEDPNARDLFLAALKYPSTYKQVEWLDRAEGPLPDADVEFPELKRAAAFTCSDERCSRPAYSAEELKTIIQRDK